MESAKAPAGVRKSKKKQVKNELDRIKQAEKKKRRLEKALATSAAIRSELEKKKQKRKEEQEKLDEEGAAVAEAVALQVLLGEDSDDSDKLTPNKDEGLTFWDNHYSSSFDLGGQPLVPCQDISNYPLEGLGWVSNSHVYGHLWNPTTSVVRSEPLGGDFRTQYIDEEGWNVADFLAAQAVTSLQIADDAGMDAYFFNHVLQS